MIRLIESIMGVRHIERLLEQRHEYFDAGVDVWSTALALLDLKVERSGFPLEQIPESGPLIFVCNHPFGLPDGIVGCHLAHQVRRDFRVLAIDILTQIPEVKEWVLPVDFSATREAQETNLKSRAEALQLLRDGGALVLFPAGEVATAPKVLGPAVESQWASFLGRMILKTDAGVVPLFFEGKNTWKFHLASRFSETVRLAMLVHETRRKIGKKIPVTVGEPIPHQELKRFDDRRELVQFLQSLTLNLANTGS